MGGFYGLSEPQPGGTQFNFLSFNQNVTSPGLYNNTNLITESASTADTARTTGVRWVCPSVITKDNIRLAQLVFFGLGGDDAWDDPWFTVSGSKKPNHLGWGWDFAGTAGTPEQDWLANHTTAMFDVGQDNVPGYPHMLMLTGGSTYDVTDIVLEIMNTPGWASGSRALPFLLRGRRDVGHKGWLGVAPGSGGDWSPRLMISFGDVSGDAIDFDLIFAGDSHMAYPGHAGFIRYGIDTLVFGGVHITGPAGMGADPGTTTTGFSPYGGDNHRGWTEQGVIQGAMEAKWGLEIAPYRSEYAVAGSECAQWAAQAEIGGAYWDVGFTDRLGHPLSDSGHQLIVMTMLGNDVHRYGSENLISGPDYYLPTVDANWDGIMESFDAKMRTIIDKILDSVPDHSKAYIYCPGYPNFGFMSQASYGFDRGWGGPVVCLASGAYSDWMRQVYCLQLGGGGGSGAGYRQWYVDTQLESMNPYGTAIAVDQSSVRYAQARWQQINHPEEIPPGAEFNPSGTYWDWPINILFSGFPPGASALGFPYPGIIQHSAWMYAGIDMWLHGLRHVTDITINQRMWQVVDTLWRRMAEDYAGHVIYRPSWNLLPVDEDWSADPTSQYAQSNAWSYWVEGIHQNLDGLNIQYSNAKGQLDQMARYVPFLQRLSPMFTEYTGTEELPVFFQGMWDGTVVDEDWYVGEMWDG